MAAVLKACTYLLFGDFSIANIPFIWVNIKFNFYELDSRDVYSLHVKTQWQVFFFSGYLCSSCRGTPCNMVSPYSCTALRSWVTRFIRLSVTQKTAQTWVLARLFAHSSSFISFELNGFDSIFWRRVCERFIFLLPFTQMSKVAKEQIKQEEKTQLQVSMEKSPLLQDTSCPCRDFVQKAKSRGGTLVTRAYIKESTYSWNIQSYSQ